MTQMNLWPKAKSGKQIKSRSGPRNGDAGESSETDGQLQSVPAKLNAAIENSQRKHPSTSRVELVTSLFIRFRESEEQNKDANNKKAAIFADAKAAGLDAGALRAAFRQRLREFEKPEVGERHDTLNSLTRGYLEALRADHASTGQIDTSHPVTPCDPSQVCAEPLARSRTRERTSVGADARQTVLPKPQQPGTTPDPSNPQEAIEDKSDIPESLGVDRSPKELACSN